MIELLKVRMERIDEAVNDMPVNRPEFLDCEHAIVELKAAIHNLESAIGHIAESLSERVIWRLDHVGEDWRRE